MPGRPRLHCQRHEKPGRGEGECAHVPTAGPLTAATIGLGKRMNAFTKRVRRSVETARREGE
jgi:hypothetical protein